MDIGEILSDSIRYPSSDWIKVIVLGILSVLGFLIIPIFLVSGYSLRVIKASLAGSDELPDFDDWGEMFIDGLKLIVVEILYFLIPLIIIFAGILASAGALSNPNTLDPSVVVGLMGGTAIIGFILMLIIIPLFAIAIANMAYYDEFGAAFRFGEILEIINAIGWVDLIVWYVSLIIVSVGIIFITSIVSIIPIIGIIIYTLIIYPYYSIFLARSTAWIYASQE